jgi:hypothetical protein
MTLDATTPSGSAVVVLGMARSGTSAVTRLLALLGVELGPQAALLPPAGENAKGFFEHRPIVQLNKELLQRLGGTWSQPPLPAPGWEQDRGLEDLRERARALLAADFAAARLWGFKDPRTSLTLPFWDLLLGGDVRYVVCHRRPLDSARSLERRDRIRLDDGVALWTRYMSSALAHTAGRSRFILGYDELFADREALVGELAGFLGVGEAGAGVGEAGAGVGEAGAGVGESGGPGGVGESGVSPQVRAEVGAWIAEDLRHHAGTLRELVEHPAVSAEAQALHLLLELAAGSRGSDEVEDALDGMAGALLRREAARAALAPGRLARPAQEPRSPVHQPAPRPTPAAATRIQIGDGVQVSIVVVLGDDPWGAMACLESLSELAPGSPPHEIVLVDNESLGLRATLAALEGDVRIVRLPERIRVDEALRAGVEAATGRIVVQMPEPALLAPDALTAICAEAIEKGPAPSSVEGAARSHGEGEARSHGEGAARSHGEDAARSHGEGAARSHVDAAAHATPPPAPLCRRGPGVEPIEVSVVIPTLDAASAELRACVRAVQATIRVAHEIVVLDNGAPPQGFTAPVNAALRAARGRHLVVMNDDVRVLDGWWEPLADALDRGAPLVFPLTVAGRMRWEFAAWCFAMRRETLADMASAPGEFFDPSMVVWCQDADLRKRLSAQGTPPLCVPESRIRHVGSRTLRVAAPHNALRNWIHAQAGRDTAIFRARYPEETSLSDGQPPGMPVLTPAHAELALAEQPISFRADGPAWESRTLAWPSAAAGHFFLAGAIEVHSHDSAQDILVRAIFAGEQRELYWIDLVPGVLGTGRTAFVIPRERARAIRLSPDEAPADWSQVRSLRLCARSRLRGALRRAPSAPGATTALLTNLRLLAQTALTSSPPVPTHSAPVGADTRTSAQVSPADTEVA